MKELTLGIRECKVACSMCKNANTQACKDCFVNIEPSNYKSPLEPIEDKEV